MRLQGIGMATNTLSNPIRLLSEKGLNLQESRSSDDQENLGGFSYVVGSC